MQPFADAFYARRGYLIATRIGDKKRDLILQSQAGNHQSIEEKFRGAVRDDVLVEIMQDAVSGELDGCITVRRTICTTSCAQTGDVPR